MDSFSATRRNTTPQLPSRHRPTSSRKGGGHTNNSSTSAMSHQEQKRKSLLRIATVIVVVVLVLVFVGIRRHVAASHNLSPAAQSLRREQQTHNQQQGGGLGNVPAPPPPPPPPPGTVGRLRGDGAGNNNAVDKNRGNQHRLDAIGGLLAGEGVPLDAAVARPAPPVAQHDADVVAHAGAVGGAGDKEKVVSVKGAGDDGEKKRPDSGVGHHDAAHAAADGADTTLTDSSFESFIIRSLSSLSPSHSTVAAEYVDHNTIVSKVRAAMGCASRDGGGSVGQPRHNSNSNSSSSSSGGGGIGVDVWRPYSELRTHGLHALLHKRARSSVVPLPNGAVYGFYARAPQPQPLTKGEGGGASKEEEGCDAVEEEGREADLPQMLTRRQLYLNSAIALSPLNGGASQMSTKNNVTASAAAATIVLCAADPFPSPSSSSASSPRRGMMPAPTPSSSDISISRSDVTLLDAFFNGLHHRVVEADYRGDAAHVLMKRMKGMMQKERMGQQHDTHDGDDENAWDDDGDDDEAASNKNRKQKGGGEKQKKNNVPFALPIRVLRGVNIKAVKAGGGGNADAAATVVDDGPNVSVDEEMVSKAVRRFQQMKLRSSATEGEGEADDSNYYTSLPCTVLVSAERILPRNVAHSLRYPSLASSSSASYPSPPSSNSSTSINVNEGDGGKGKKRGIRGVFSSLAHQSAVSQMELMESGYSLLAAPSFSSSPYAVRTTGAMSKSSSTGGGSAVSQEEEVEGITRLYAQSRYGLLNGLRTLMQLTLTASYHQHATMAPTTRGGHHRDDGQMPSSPPPTPPLQLITPCVYIRHDVPKLPWRGQHIDSSRHFVAVPTVLSLLREMGKLKMNRLHWHLSDDQGWRMESRLFPQLHTVGSRRGEALNGAKSAKYLNNLAFESPQMKGALKEALAAAAADRRLDDANAFGGVGGGDGGGNGAAVPPHLGLLSAVNGGVGVGPDTASYLMEKLSPQSLFKKGKLSREAVDLMLLKGGEGEGGRERKLTAGGGGNISPSSSLPPPSDFWDDYLAGEHFAENERWYNHFLKASSSAESSHQREQHAATSPPHPRRRKVPRRSYYSIDDARFIVRYAAQRGIVVVPEVDLPAHAHALVTGMLAEQTLRGAEAVVAAREAQHALDDDKEAAAAAGVGAAGAGDDAGAGEGNINNNPRLAALLRQLERLLRGDGGEEDDAEDRAKQRKLLEDLIEFERQKEQHATDSQRIEVKRLAKLLLGADAVDSGGNGGGRGGGEGEGRAAGQGDEERGKVAVAALSTPSFIRGRINSIGGVVSPAEGNDDCGPRHLKRNKNKKGSDSSPLEEEKNQLVVFNRRHAALMAAFEHTPQAVNCMGGSFGMVYPTHEAAGLVKLILREMIDNVFGVSAGQQFSDATAVRQASSGAIGSSSSPSSASLSSSALSTFLSTLSRHSSSYFHLGGDQAEFIRGRVWDSFFNAYRADVAEARQMRAERRRRNRRLRLLREKQQQQQQQNQNKQPGDGDGDIGGGHPPKKRAGMALADGGGDDGAVEANEDPRFVVDHHDAADVMGVGGRGAALQRHQQQQPVADAMTGSDYDDDDANDEEFDEDGDGEMDSLKSKNDAHAVNTNQNSITKNNGKVIDAVVLGRRAPRRVHNRRVPSSAVMGTPLLANITSDKDYGTLQAALTDNLIHYLTHAHDGGEEGAAVGQPELRVMQINHDEQFEGARGGGGQEGKAAAHHAEGGGADSGKRRKAMPATATTSTVSIRDILTRQMDVASLLNAYPSSSPSSSSSPSTVMNKPLLPPELNPNDVRFLGNAVSKRLEELMALVTEGGGEGGGSEEGRRSTAKRNNDAKSDASPTPASSPLISTAIVWDDTLLTLNASYVPPLHDTLVMLWRGDGINLRHVRARLGRGDARWLDTVLEVPMPLTTASNTQVLSATGAAEEQSVDDELSEFYLRLWQESKQQQSQQRHNEQQQSSAPAAEEGATRPNDGGGDDASADSLIAATPRIILTPKTHAYFDYIQHAPMQKNRYLPMQSPAPWVGYPSVTLRRTLEMHALAEEAPPEALPPSPLIVDGSSSASSALLTAPFNPVATPFARNLVLGVQGSVWTELIKDGPALDYQLFPRVMAIADAGWSRRAVVAKKKTLKWKLFVRPPAVVEAIKAAAAATAKEEAKERRNSNEEQQQSSSSLQFLPPPEQEYNFRLATLYNNADGSLAFRSPSKLLEEEYDGFEEAVGLLNAASAPQRLV